MRLGKYPLAKASHWATPEKAGYLLFEARVGKPTGSSECCFQNGYGDVLFFGQNRSRFFCFTVYQEATMQPSSNFILTKAERQLIELIRSIDYGELRIMVKDEKPIRVEEIRRSIQLQSEK